MIVLKFDGGVESLLNIKSELANNPKCTFFIMDVKSQTLNVYDINILIDGYTGSSVIRIFDIKFNNELLYKLFHSSINVEFTKTLYNALKYYINTSITLDIISSKDAKLRELGLI